MMSDKYYFIKENVSKKEYLMHKFINNIEYVNSPKIIEYDEKRKILKMQKISNMSVSDFYGENKENVPEFIFKKIRNTLNILYNVGIIYPDITGYNFIHSNNKIWIIDFEHAHFINKEPNKFVDRFLEGSNEWNEEFK